jgi:hypothetical protein
MLGAHGERLRLLEPTKLEHPRLASGMYCPNRGTVYPLNAPSWVPITLVEAPGKYQAERPRIPLDLSAKSVPAVFIQCQLGEAENVDP